MHATVIDQYAIALARLTSLETAARALCDAIGKGGFAAELKALRDVLKGVPS